MEDPNPRARGFVRTNLGPVPLVPAELELIVAWASSARTLSHLLHPIQICLRMNKNRFEDLSVNNSPLQIIREYSLGLKTRVEIEGSSVMEREPNLFETLRVICRGEGSPAPELRWYWNDVQVRSEWEGWTVLQERSERTTL